MMSWLSKAASHRGGGLRRRLLGRGTLLCALLASSVFLFAGQRVLGQAPPAAPIYRPSPPAQVLNQGNLIAAVGEDPRDAKLRELEARLAETERQLRESAARNRRASVQGGESQYPGVQVSATQPSDDVGGPRDYDMPSDQDRLSGLEQRFEDLADRLKSVTTANPIRKDEFPTFRLTGFTQLDSVWYSQSPLNLATVGNAQDGVGFRRARLAVVGKAAEFTYYQLEVDFATAGRPSFFDNYLEQENIPYLGSVRAGQYLQPFSVDAMSGFRNLPFLERSLPFLTFVPFRRVGIMAWNTTEDQRTQWAYSVFRTGGFANAPLGDSRFATDIGDKGGVSFSTRATHLVYYDELAKDRYLWHVGGSYDFSQLGANTATNSPSRAPFYQARTSPEIFLGFPENMPPTFGPGSAFAGTPNFVDTGRYPASSFNLFGLETVYQKGPFSFQSEWMATQVNSAVGSIFYNGAYVEGMYRLTGEHRDYDKKLAALKNAVPYTDFIPLKRRGIVGWGAWEIAARLSYVDLRNPASLNGHYIQGTNSSGNGRLTDTTFGLTWFMNPHTKVQFNWIHAMLHNTAKGNSYADVFATRLQVDF